jgi:outer membrane receptor protein involved in Fe transport
MKKMLTLLTMCLLLAIVGNAQTAKVVGKIINAQTGASVEGATILVKGKNTGTVSLNDGSFTIAAAEGETLVISSLGYANKEIAATAATMEISLEAINSTLTDVVVVGYGSQRKATLTGAQVQLKNEELTRRQVSSASQALQGLAPGVTVQQQSGRPGADGASIRIRGESSILGNSNPLVIIDGLQMPNATGLDALNQIDPNAIETITVLKDAASTAIYGNRGVGRRNCS